MKTLLHSRSGKIPAAESPTLNSLQKQKSLSRGSKENVDPEFSAISSAAVKPPLAPKIRSPLHPRPLPNPGDTPLKRKKLCLETVAENGAPLASASESGVQVIVRMRPLNKDIEEDDEIVEKISSDSVSIHDHVFTFDSVADTRSTQEDVFQLVGLPLVENCLAGFNSSIFAYGQTGSGKTFTMWGPSNATLEDLSSDEERGLTPRVFERLFSRIQEEQIKHADMELYYQCRCSFLEIYNEQIMDLLDPSQRNLQIREDVRTGVYVDCLSEEYVCSVKDVIGLLSKGLLNRRTGATSANSESSRSHCVFTCVIESHSKNIADGLTSLKVSRINLVDLAGSERQKFTRAAGERLKEAGNINRSLSQLGNVINILAEISQTGKQRHIPYRDSKLTFLLQESLGGNAKLAMICAISPSQSCKSESFSTLRFAQRAKAIQNKAVVNEISQDDVRALREQIRLLKDELLRMKANGSSSEANTNFSTEWNARRSLNLLRMSLGQHAVDLTFDNTVGTDDDNDVDIDDRKAQSSDEKHVDENEHDEERDIHISKDEDTQVQERDIHISSDGLFNNSLKDTTSDAESDLRTVRCNASSNLIPEDDVLISKDPSPIYRARNKGKRAYHASLDHLSMSLQHGIDVITNRHHKSLKGLDFKPVLPIQKVEVGVQAEENWEGSSTFICSYCREIHPHQYENTKKSHDHELQRVPSDIMENKKDNDYANELKVVQTGVFDDNEKTLEVTAVSLPATNSLSKSVDKVLAGAIRREMALQEHCSVQNAEINQLKRLIQQYKHERECNAIIAQSREDKISRLEGLVDGILPTEKFMEEEFMSLANEHRLLREKYGNHPEVLEAKIELRRVEEELKSHRNFYDFGERDVMIDEIDKLRNHLESYITSPQKRSPLLQITSFKDEILEEERCLWAEAESKWLSLIEELEVKLQENLSLTDRLKMELDSEKRCSEELKEALQTAMKGHARILDQYADLQEKHITMLIRHQKIMDGMEDVKKMAAKAGVKGAESKFITSLAAQVSALKVERERERKFWREENRVLEAQLRDTAEAVHAAGELVVRLEDSEREVKNAKEEIEALKRKHDREIEELSQGIIKSMQPHEETYNHGHDWREGFMRKDEGFSWYSGYDQCNL